MGKLVSWVALIYLATCTFAVPIAFMQLWDLAFSVQKLGHGIALLLLVCWIVVGAKICLAFAASMDSRIELRAKEIAPENFTPQLVIKGLHAGEYIGFDSVARQVVLVDIRREYAACQNFDFIQGWSLETFGNRAMITFSFNSLEFSTLRIPISPTRCDDLAAKLKFVV